MFNLHKTIYSLLFVSSCLLFLVHCRNGAGHEDVSYTLTEEEFVRVLSPNGGETLPYGDILTVTWLMRVDVMDQAVITISSGLNEGCHYTPTEPAWFDWPWDSVHAMGIGTMNMVDEEESLVLCSAKIPVRDTTVEEAYCDGPITFSGDSMMIRIWDPYGDEAECDACIAGDGADGFFSITR